MTVQDKPKDWKTFDDFSDGIATNRLPRSEVLVGKTFNIALKNGRTIDLAFTAIDSVSWSENGRGAVDWYEAIEVAPNVVFINMTFASAPTDDEAFIVNTATRRVLSVRETVRGEGEVEGEPRVGQDWVPGQIGDSSLPTTGIEPGPTRDLIGLIAHYRYSPNHLYEHHYLSSERYAWQNLIGVQRGHGDVDLATTFKFDEGLYVFGFREFLIPVASLFFYNFEDRRSTGKFLGLDNDGGVVNRPAGAIIEKKTRISYDEGAEPV